MARSQNLLFTNMMDGKSAHWNSKGLVVLDVNEIQNCSRNDAVQREGDFEIRSPCHIEWRLHGFQDCDFVFPASETSNLSNRENVHILHIRRPRVLVIVLIWTVSEYIKVSTAALMASLSQWNADRYMQNFCAQTLSKGRLLLMQRNNQHSSAILSRAMDWLRRFECLRRIRKSCGTPPRNSSASLKLIGPEWQETPRKDFGARVPH
jgi:hypothetical protein